MNEMLFLIVEGIDLNQEYYGFDEPDDIEHKVMKHYEISEEFPIETDKEEIGAYYLKRGNIKPLHIVFDRGWVIFKISQEDLSKDMSNKDYISDFVLSLIIFLKAEKERQEEERIRLAEESNKKKEIPNFEWL